MLKQFILTFPPVFVVPAFGVMCSLRILEAAGHNDFCNKLMKLKKFGFGKKFFVKAQSLSSPINKFCTLTSR